MYTVEYGYYNYPKKTKEFKTYESAKKFFYYIGKRNGVKKVSFKWQELDKCSNHAILIK